VSEARWTISRTRPGLAYIMVGSENVNDTGGKTSWPIYG
jgi:hypothetical protein